MKNKGFKKNPIRKVPFRYISLLTLGLNNAKLKSQSPLFNIIQINRNDELLKTKAYVVDPSALLPVVIAMSKFSK